MAARGKRYVPAMVRAERERKAIQQLDGAAILRLRRKFNMTQAEFWAPLGVTQSGGSRYEGGRTAARPIALLLRCVYMGDTLPKVEPVPESERIERFRARGRRAKTRRARK